MKKTASAKWQGTLTLGKGSLTTESGSLSAVPYSYGKRFDQEKGLNPEELIAAAHAGCFSMALSGEFEKLKLKAEYIDVEAQVSLEKVADEWSIPSVHLIMSAKVPGATVEQFEEAANAAKLNCPVSKLLRANITLESKMISSEQKAA